MVEVLYLLYLHSDYKSTLKNEKLKNNEEFYLPLFKSRNHFMSFASLNMAIFYFQHTSFYKLP